MEPELLDGERTSVPQLPPRQDYKDDHRKCHCECKPLECLVSKPGWRPHPRLCRGLFHRDGCGYSHTFLPVDQQP